MKILVTGAAGFIGSHVVDAYLAGGHEVTGVDDLSSGSKNNVNPRAHFVQLDIRDPQLEAVFANSAFDVVNHHAAQIDVRRSVQDPSLDASTNILGTLRLLECSHTYGVRKFIYASSGGTIYGECARPAQEEDPPRPESPYGLSKAAAEAYIRVLGKTYPLPYTILRYGNVYGPRQDPSGEAGVISIFIGKLLAGQPATIYGSGRQERDYVYVEDVARANLAALTRGENQVFNIGTGIAISVNTLHQKIAALAAPAPGPRYAPPRAGELERSVLNFSQAERDLAWRPQVTLAEGLERTFRFFAPRKMPLAQKT